MEPYIVSAETIAEFPGQLKTHFLNPNAVRRNKSLGDLVGLKQIGFHLIEIEPGRESTEYHRHYHEEECVYVLSGTATVTIGEQTYRVKAGDFIGYPAGGEAHTMVNDGEEMLVCIVVGQRLPIDVGEYPRLGKRIYRYNGKWDVVKFSDIDAVK